MSTTIATRIIDVEGARLQVRCAGPADGRPVVLLHGWPEDSSAWEPMMSLAAGEFACFAVDLPGIGGSTAASNGDKRELARAVHECIGTLGLEGPTLVGQDVGGMVAFAYLRQFCDLSAAVIMDTVIPGVPPWDEVIANPWIWHFAFHTIPDLPEQLVAGNIGAYFDFFYQQLAAHPEAIGPDARRRYVEAYSRPEALRQGFEFYRALWSDAPANQQPGPAVTAPLLYVRGEQEGGDMTAYAEGLRTAGIPDVRIARVPDAGHFTAEEQPEETWRVLSRFIRAVG